jgi:hypothetical protein
MGRGRLVWRDVAHGSVVGIAAVAGLASLALAHERAEAGRPLLTAIQAPTAGGAEGSKGLERIRAAGATVTRINVRWPAVTSLGRPRRPEDPGDPAYRWDDIDRAVTMAKAQGLEPLPTIHDAPRWAQEHPDDHAVLGPNRPHPREFASFARAAAERYSGRWEGLPRVRYWMVWNEPNLNTHFRPQIVRGRPFSPIWYREAVNAFADAVHAVHRSNRVVAGGLAPFTIDNGFFLSVAPLRFMRELLCMSKGERPRPDCRRVTKFDVWSHHPYTSGGPTHDASSPDDVSLGDLDEMQSLLRAAQRAGRIESSGRVRLWVTEFSWDTSPPDPRGVPLRLHARWVAEALYRSWAAGVELVTWFLLRDEPFGSSPYQSGLYHRGRSIAEDRPKPALQAFRFPFVALSEAGRVYVWGRTPAGQPGRVIVERAFRGGWQKLGVVTTSRHGIFQRRFRSTSDRGYLRARMLGTGEQARPFALQGIADKFFNPFGSPG